MGGACEGGGGRQTLRLGLRLRGGPALRPNAAAPRFSFGWRDALWGWSGPSWRRAGGPCPRQQAPSAIDGGVALTGQTPRGVRTRGRRRRSSPSPSTTRPPRTCRTAGASSSTSSPSASCSTRPASRHGRGGAAREGVETGSRAAPGGKGWAPHIPPGPCHPARCAAVSQRAACRPKLAAPCPAPPSRPPSAARPTGQGHGPVASRLVASAAT